MRPRLLDLFEGGSVTTLICLLSAGHLWLAWRIHRRGIPRRLQQLSLFASAEPPPPPPRRHKGLTGGAYNPPGQSPHSNAREPKHKEPEQSAS